LASRAASGLSGSVTEAINASQNSSVTNAFYNNLTFSEKQRFNKDVTNLMVSDGVVPLSGVSTTGYREQVLEKRQEELTTKASKAK